jgi:hypothetical protein
MDRKGIRSKGPINDRRLKSRSRWLAGTLVDSPDVWFADIPLYLPEPRLCPTSEQGTEGRCQ